MHTRFSLRRPFQTSENPPEANAMSPSFEMVSESTQERGSMVCEPQTLRRMRTLLLWRSRSMFGASKACTGGGGQAGCSDHHWPAHLIEDVDEVQSIVSLQRHRGVRTLLRCQHLSERVWEPPQSGVDGHELGEEGIHEGWRAW